MTLLDACLWGLSGAGAIEVIELYSSIKTKKDFPWRLPGELPLELFLFCVVIRLALGVFAAVLCANGGRLSVAGAVAAGIAAPKVLEQLGRLPVAASLAAVSLSGSSTSESADTTETPPSEGGSVDEA
jgi:hypothetical protein